tara:strand:+ start:298 stop:513 length:216 start_codon:yes stop_codon:yes gene_type:complete
MSSVDDAVTMRGHTLLPLALIHVDSQMECDAVRVTDERSKVMPAGAELATKDDSIGDTSRADAARIVTSSA